MKPANPPEQTLEQMRMRFALLAVKHCTDSANPQALSVAQFKEFGTRCHSLPAQILQNGLNQTLAFCLSRPAAKAAPYEALAGYLDAWLSGRGLVASMGLAHPVAVLQLASDETRPLLELLLEHDIDRYMAATQEALALLHHLKRFASAFKIETPAEADNEA